MKLVSLGDGKIGLHVLLPAGPHAIFCEAHVRGTHEPASIKPHWLGVPPPK